VVALLQFGSFKRPAFLLSSWA